MSTNSTSKYIEELRKILKKCTSNTLWGHHNEFEILILYKTDVKHIVELFEKQNSEFNKKDKIIDLMADLIYEISKIFPGTVFHALISNGFDLSKCNGRCQEKFETCKKCIKQYFERKVEDERN